MKKLAVTATLFVFALSSPFCVTPSSAKEKAAKPEASATPAASPSPTATPKPKKPSLLDRLNPFQRHEKKPKATPTPAATATPAPTAKPSPTPKEEKHSTRKHKAAPEPTPEPTATATPKPHRKPRPTPTTEAAESTPTPAPKKSDEAPATGMNSPLPFSPEATAAEPEATPATAPSLPSGIDDEVVLKARYSAVKSQALEDKDILALQDKADAARDQDTQRSLTKAYYRALFDKMRTIDPSLKDRIDRIETATMKRLQTMGASADE